jgi:hypothetical protein
MGRVREGVERLAEYAERRTGYTVMDSGNRELLEASDRERRTLQKELDLLAYSALDYVGGAPQELKPPERRKLAQQSRIAWMKDPLAGAAVDLMNDFVFGRGLPRPKAADEEVQKIIDEAWDDPDNQLVLTSYPAQLALGTDLSLQSNLFFLVFDDGADGKVKLGILDHDSVQTVVRDPDNRLRILYFLAHETEVEWDYKTDQPKMAIRPNVDLAKIVYYEHWRNVDDARNDAQAGDRSLPELAPDERVPDGRVFHIAINKTVEMAFGHPIMDRLLRWYNAYNKFMDARVDIMEAGAAFALKRKSKATQGQLEKQATQALSRRSALGQSLDFPDAMAGPKKASIYEENDTSTLEQFKFDSGSANAQGDAQMLRAQVSASTRFPQSYYGDATNSTLATATSLELPVLKAVENRQELFEALCRFFLDRVIERAVETGRLSSDLSPEERSKLEADKSENDVSADGTVASAQGQPTSPVGTAPGQTPPLFLGEAHEDAIADEESTARDLSYEFSMPSPLKRMMADLVTAVMNIARTFDPNNTNMELSRTLLTVALGDALELEDAAGLVEKIFPPGYEDPAVAAMNAMQAQGQMTDPKFGEFAPASQGGTIGADGNRHTESNAYGAPSSAQPAEKVMEGAVLPDAMKEKLTHRRGTRKGLDDTVLAVVEGGVS